MRKVLVRFEDSVSPLLKRRLKLGTTRIRYMNLSSFLSFFFDLTHFHHTYHLQSTLILLLRPEPAACAPTINLKDITRHMRRAHAGNKQDQPSEILRLANSPRRLTRYKRIHGLPHPESGHLGREDTRADAVDGDVVAHELTGLDLRQVDACRFAWAVAEDARAWGRETAFGS